MILNLPLDGIPLDLMVDHRYHMRKAESGIDNEDTLGCIEFASGEEGTIWNHGSGWTAKLMSAASCNQGGRNLRVHL